MSKTLFKYDKRKIKEALEDIELGMSVKSASKKYGIPRTTLIRHKNSGGKVLSIGRKTVFSQEQETLLANWLIKMSKAGFPIDKETFLGSVAKLKTTLNIKCEGSHNWYEGFMKRHKILSLRSYQNLTKSRSSVSIEAIYKWFEEVEEYLKNNNLFQILEQPRRIFNADESAFYLNPKGGKVLAERGSKFVYLANSNDEKENVTVLLNANASGEFAPPMAVFRYKRMPEKLASSLPDSWTIGRSESGWMTQETMFEYVANYFHPWLVKNDLELPVIFFLDGHVSHLSLNLSEFCSENGIILIALYPNATHLLQPMDVAVFKGLKVQWKKKVQEWRIKNDFKEMKRHEFCPLLEEALSNFDGTCISNGFRKCGLVPWNRYAVKIPLLTQQEPVQPELTTAAAVSTENSFLKMLEKNIGDYKLQQFKSNVAEWKGDIEDKSLYDLWLRSANTIVVTQSDKEINCTAVDHSPNDFLERTVENDVEKEMCCSDFDQRSISFDQPVIETDVEREINCSDLDQRASFDEPVIETDVEKGMNCSDLNQGAINFVEPAAVAASSSHLGQAVFEEATRRVINTMVPSPFKKNILFETDKPCTVTSKVRMPAVIKSPEARQYLLKKEENKKGLLKRREDSRKAREAKKRAREEENCAKKLKRAEKVKKENREAARKRIFSGTESDSVGEAPDSGSSTDGEWLVDNDTENEEPYVLLSAKREKGEFVAVKYDDSIFAGVIIEVLENGARVKAMKRNGQLWKWPERDDICVYLWEDVLGHLEAPRKFSTRRDIYSIPELENFS